jgi:exonuclease VII small subunit
MKSKNIPADIRKKTIKEAQNEIKEIIENLENNEIKLGNSLENYNRMMLLNNHIQDQFKKKAKEINRSALYKRKKSNKK